MDAVVTLKATPMQFDVIRKALLSYKDAKLAEGDDASVPPAQRREAKTEALQASDILKGLI